MSSSGIAAMIDLFTIRQAGSDDSHHVVNSFLHTLHRRTGRKHPTEAAKAHMLRCLAAGTVFVAHPLGQPDLIAGWVAWDCSGHPRVAPELLYIHVKPPFRAGRAGAHVATLLVLSTLPAAVQVSGVVTCPYITKDGTKLLTSLNLGVRCQ
jgi:hypothetical protein